MQMGNCIRTKFNFIQPCQSKQKQNCCFLPRSRANLDERGRSCKRRCQQALRPLLHLWSSAAGTGQLGGCRQSATSPGWLPQGPRVFARQPKAGVQLPALWDRHTAKALETHASEAPMVSSHFLKRRTCLPSPAQMDVLDQPLWRDK